MGTQETLIHRVVFDTNAVVSALLFANGRLAWLRRHWRSGNCVSLISSETAAELTRVLAYPKFRLSPDDRLELLGDYLPFCEIVKVTRRCPITCRDPKDQGFLDLSQCGRAALGVTGDKGLLALKGRTGFTIETLEEHRLRMSAP